MARPEPPDTGHPGGGVARGAFAALRSPGACLLVLAALAGPASAATERAVLTSGERVALVDRKELFLEAAPLGGEGLLAFCRRLTGGSGDCREIARLNRNPKRLLAGVRYRVPYPMLTSDLKLSALRALFPEDRATPEGWRHRSRGEDLSRTAEWLTGKAANATAIRKANGRKDDRTRAGDSILVPDALLMPGFRAPPAPPTPQVRTPAATISAAPSPAAEVQAGLPLAAPGTSVPAVALEYGEDGLGRHAIYRLRGGEALYSAVVMRLTGRVHAEDVNGLAAEIALRSGIVDVTDIPIGYPVKVPFDLLLPEFLPVGDPRRLEWEVERALADQFKNEVEARGLAGVTVILDPGHGGADVGASMAGVWESNYVYDIALRVKRALEERSRARVEITTRDGGGYLIVDRDVLPFSRGHRVMTTPPYTIGDSTVGVHLRWYLANSAFRRATSQGDPAKVVFVSIHADSLHPSVRGATAYVPDVAGTAGSFGKAGPVFQERKEYREQPKVSYPLATRQKSEGLSRDLAGRMIATFRERGLGVHPFQPVRDKIYRGRRAWVPAVLRYNAVPAKMLLEVCNLANPEDRKLLQTRAFREKVARTIADGLAAYFGEAPLR